MLIQGLACRAVKADRTAHRSWRVVIVSMMSALMLCASATAAAAKVGKATVPDSMIVAGQELPLRGAGLRTRAVFKLYAAALYTDDIGNGSAVASSDAPMAIQLHILSKLLTKDRMVKALKEGFNKSTNGDVSEIQDGIDQMIDALDKPLKRGVVVTLAYEPDVGTIMTRDDDEPVTIEGLAFKKALFLIWLGTKPAQVSLKDGMLG